MIPPEKSMRQPAAGQSQSDLGASLVYVFHCCVRVIVITPLACQRDVERGLGRSFPPWVELGAASDRAPSSSNSGPRWISHQRGPFLALPACLRKSGMTGSLLQCSSLFEPHHTFQRQTDDWEFRRQQSAPVISASQNEVSCCGRPHFTTRIQELVGTSNSCRTVGG